MTFIREIARRCAAAGVRVIYVPGCERRGNGQSWARWPEGPVNHHTAGSNNIYVDRILIDGRADLDGPLTNFATLYDGDLALVAEHPANHAGSSGGWDTWPLPITRLFNRQTVGNEIQYRGTEPMSPAQWRTIVIFNRVVLDVLAEIGEGVLDHNGDPMRIKFHQGTSVTGKWDPGYAPGKTYSIRDFRRTVAASAVQQPAPTPSSNRLRDEMPAESLPPGQHVRKITYPIGPSVSLLVNRAWFSLAATEDSTATVWTMGRGAEAHKKWDVTLTKDKRWWAHLPDGVDQVTLHSDSTGSVGWCLELEPR